MIKIFIQLIFRIKNKVDITSLDTKIVNELLVDAKSYCKDTLKDVDILHIKIDQFYIDNNYFENFFLIKKIVKIFN